MTNLCYTRLINFNCPVIHLTHSLHLNVVSMAMIFTFTFDVAFKVFSDILREVVFIPKTLTYEPKPLLWLKFHLTQASICIIL